jgi:hypothetical protein
MSTLSESELLVAALVILSPLTVVVLVAIFRGYNVKIWRENRRHTTRNEDTDD